MKVTMKVFLNELITLFIILCFSSSSFSNDILTKWENSKILLENAIPCKIHTLSTSTRTFPQRTNTISENSILCTKDRYKYIKSQLSGSLDVDQLIRMFDSSNENSKSNSKIIYTKNKSYHQNNYKDLLYSDIRVSKTDTGFQKPDDHPLIPIEVFVNGKKAFDYHNPQTVNTNGLETEYLFTRPFKEMSEIYVYRKIIYDNQNSSFPKIIETGFLKKSDPSHLIPDQRYTIEVNKDNIIGYDSFLYEELKINNISNQTETIRSCNVQINDIETNMRILPEDFCLLLQKGQKYIEYDSNQNRTEVIAEEDIIIEAQ